jgi:hypothetical protein
VDLPVIASGSTLADPIARQRSKLQPICFDAKIGGDGLSQ